MKTKGFYGVEMKRLSAEGEPTLDQADIAGKPHFCL